MADPVTGGRYIRDPKTGALTKANEKAAASIEVVATEFIEPETEVAPVATAKKGK
ncbi:hypothetical protein ACTOV4_07225 [Brucella sp. C7-11G]